ncbi:hypothetical protein G3M53_22145, partial [Streptomyces sp. SID7982]|nr:hypothetical protein [Streptomyces sp. SID7982]
MRRAGGTGGRVAGPGGTGSARSTGRPSGPGELRVLPAGPYALLVELADGEHAEAFHAELLRRRERG